MLIPTRTGPGVGRWPARGRMGKQALTTATMGWLLVVSLAACGGDDYEAATTVAGTYAPATTSMAQSASGTAVPDRRSASSAPATTMVSQATEVVTETEMIVEATAEAEAAMAAAEAASMAMEEALSDASYATATTGNANSLALPSDTTFKDYQQSGFVSASADSISTFSLDTDRTSYQLALAWAYAGYDVDPDSVRAEEWINAFDYGYRHPSDLDSFAILTDLVRHPLDDRKYLARIGFQAPEFRDDRPVNVTLVVDASGSMTEGNRIDIAREAAETIRRGLTDRDRIAVVHFTEEVIHEYTVEHSHPDDRRVGESIQRLAPHGSTNVQAGLDLGVMLADEARRNRPEAYNYVILLSDGVANVDATDPFAILESAHDNDSSNPLRLITIGVGISNYNDYLLEQLAQYGNGWYRYLNDVYQARSTFSRDNWLALSTPFADQTRAQVIWNDEVVESWRMIGYENRITSDESFVEDRREFAEIPVGAATTVFYELNLNDRVARNPDRPVELADINLRWVTPTSGRSNRQSSTMWSSVDADFPSADELLQFGSVVALAADRYGSLPYVDVVTDIGWDLRVLEDRLVQLAPHLGGLDSFADFAFLLDLMIGAVPFESSGDSGYSR